MVLPLLATATSMVWPVPAIVCHRAEGKVEIDGHLTEPCWRRAAWATGFSLLGSGEPARAQTLFAVLYDDRRLYVAVECMEPNTEGLVVRHRERDSQVWLDDAVEIFVDPRHSHRSYFQFVVNAAGAKFDCEGRRMNGISTDHSWNGAWTAATSVGKGAWIVELCIPLSTLGVGRPSPWAIFGFNVCRDRQPGGKGKAFEWSSWAPMTKGFHEPENFGHLLFAPSGEALPPTTLLPLLDEKARGVKIFCREGVLEFLPHPALAERELRPLASEVEDTLEEAGHELRRARLPLEQRRDFEKLLSKLWERLVLVETSIGGGTLKDWAEIRLELERLGEEARGLLWRAKFAALFAD